MQAPTPPSRQLSPAPGGTLQPDMASPAHRPVWPVSDDSQYLEVIPQEVLQASTGCLELTRYLHEGETVVHIGSNSGLVCYVAAQIVGKRGRVLGIEANELDLARSRKHLPQFRERVVTADIQFHKARPHDLGLDLERLDAWLKDHPARHSRDWLRVSELAQQLRQQSPLIATDAVDVVLVHDLLNCTGAADRPQLLAEIYRVLRRGGRVVISEVVSDEEVPRSLEAEPTHPVTQRGAYREDLLLEAFEAAGFHGIQVVRRQVDPCKTIGGIEFRYVTVHAFKGKAGPCVERNQAVIYNGPWKAVIDDDGHTLYRGKRMAVCDKTFQLYTQAPYADDITPVPPAHEIPLAAAKPFRCNSNTERDPRVTKGRVPSDLPLLSDADSDCCGPAGCC